ncbi:MAG: hypothetical protein KAS77_05645 [Thermoplasmata archaeon]|nr:hypothetical protein [Thermoplasmata archaeon]
MEYRTCINCGDHATTLLRSGKDKRSLCLRCLEEVTDRDVEREYVCSVEGCWNQPTYLVVVDNEKNSSILACDKHFRRVRDEIVSYLEIPRWLTDGEDIHANDRGVIIEIQVGSDNG